MGLSVKSLFLIAVAIGAKNAGMLSCWLNSNGLSPLDEDVKADFEIRGLDEILNVLKTSLLINNNSD